MTRLTWTFAKRTPVSISHFRGTSTLYQLRYLIWSPRNLLSSVAVRYHTVHDNGSEIKCVVSAKKFFKSKIDVTRLSHSRNSVLYFTFSRLQRCCDADSRSRQRSSLLPSLRLRVLPPTVSTKSSFFFGSSLLESQGWGYRKQELVQYFTTSRFLAPGFVGFGAITYVQYNQLPDSAISWMKYLT